MSLFASEKAEKTEVSALILYSLLQGASKIAGTCSLFVE